MKKFTYIFILLITSTLFGQEKEYQIFNSTVNSKFAELGVNFLDAETILFASSKKTENDKAFVSNRRAKNRNLFLGFYFGKLNDSSEIIQTNTFSSNVFFKFNETDFTISSDRKTIYFCWSNYYNDGTKFANVEQTTINLFKAAIDSNYNLTNISPVPFNSKEYSIRNPYLSRDGSKLFFISNMPNGYGNYDIYVSNISENGNLSKPKNLGANINTSKDDLYPYTDKNNTLYFASYGHKGKGSLDIFKSDFINRSYTEAENLPEPINSKYDDFGYVTNPLRDSGFFISNRKKGKGDVDIYGFKFKYKEIECTQLIAGLLLNNTTNKPIANAKLTIYNKNKTVDSLITAKDGSYNFKLNCNEAYKITAQKEHYISNEITFETDDNLATKINKNIELIEIPCTQLLNGIVTNAFTKELLENSNVALYKNGELISTTTVLTNGLYNFELFCNTDYIIKIEKEGFLPTEIKLETNANYNEELSNNIALKPLPCNQIVTGIVSNKLTGEPLINTDIKIYKNDKLLSSEILRSRSNFKIDLECESTYTIIAQKEGFLDSEIILKTDKQLNYTFTNNIKLSPIECNQLITGTILNKQTNEPLGNTTVKLFKNEELIDSQLIENEKNYSFNVKCNENYKIIAEKDGFKTAEISLRTNTRNEYNNNKNIQLIPLPCNQLVSGVVTNLKTGELLVNTSLKLVANGTTIKVSKTDNNSEFNFNLECDNTYTIIAQKEGFLDSEITLKTDKQLNYTFTNNIKLSPIECNQLITGTILNKQTNKPLGNTTVKLFKNEELIDSQLIENEKNYSFNVKCNENYKIIAEKDGFETAEISLRTDTRNKFNNNKNISLNPIICKQLFTGVIVDESTGNRLNNLQISLFENAVLKETINLKTLEFKFDLECNTTYKLVIEKSNYSNAEITFSTDNQNNFTVEKIVKLIPDTCFQIVNGVVLDKETNLPIASASITKYANNTKLKEILTDKDGKFNLELDCSINFDLTIKSPGYQPNRFIINATQNYNEITSKTIYLDSQEEFEIVRNNKMVNTNPIDFELNKAEITLETAIELDKVVAILKKYPTIKIEIKSHTDSRAPDNYNLELSNRRAASTVSYIISQGIDPARIYGKGYGETELLNGCSNGVKCTESEHQLNRRTEFIVIEQ